MIEKKLAGGPGGAAEEEVVVAVAIDIAPCLSGALAGEAVGKEGFCGKVVEGAFLVGDG